MTSATGGTNSVASTTPVTTRLPGNCIRASAYAAIDAVTRISSVCSVAASTLLRNHWNTGVCERPRIFAYACRVGESGSRSRSVEAISSGDFSDVDTIHTSGATNSRLSSASHR